VISVNISNTLTASDVAYHVHRSHYEEQNIQMQNSFKSENEVTRYTVMQSQQEHTQSLRDISAQQMPFENFQDFLGLMKVLRNKSMVNLSLKNESIITLPNVKAAHPQHGITAQKTGIRVTTFQLPYGWTFHKCPQYTNISVTTHGSKIKFKVLPLQQLTYYYVYAAVIALIAPVAVHN
jgi:hypothetical protein